jgi:phage-related minor tail protein
MLQRHGPAAIRILLNAWTWGINPDEAREVLSPILKTAAFLICVYVANVYDVWYAWYRSVRAWRSAASPN